MNKHRPQRIILDTTVISNYAVSGSIEYLIDVLPDPRTVPAVKEELQQGYEEGYTFLEDALDRLTPSLIRSYSNSGGLLSHAELSPP